MENIFVPLNEIKGKELLREMHEGICKGHFSGQLTTRRLLDASLLLVHSF